MVIQQYNSGAKRSARQRRRPRRQVRVRHGSGARIAPHEGGGQSSTRFRGSHSTPRRRRSEFDTFLVCIKSFWILVVA